MIFQLRHRCPHCKNVADFAITQISDVVMSEPNPNDPDDFLKRSLPPNIAVAGQTKDMKDIKEACGVTRCPLCSGPFLIVFRTPERFLQSAMARQDRPQARLIQGQTVVVVRTYPASEQPIAHPTWPPDIQQPFIDLQHMLADGRHPSFIIGGCRSVLDVATRHLGATKKDLFDRIDELADKKIITGALKDWSDKIRKDGNIAVHELNGTAEGATQLVDFLKLFLHIAFELPDAIKSKAPTVGGQSPSMP